MSHLELPFKCTICTIFLKTNDELEKHKKDKHSGDYICSYCGVKYHFKHSLTEHIQIKHEGTIKMFECPVCGIKMCRKNRMDDHMNVHNNVNPYSCHVCGKSYKNKCACKKHARVCGTDARHVCKTCGQVYKSALGVKEHTRRCHDETNCFVFYCVCGSNFKTRSSRCRHRVLCDHFQMQKANEQKGKKDVFKNVSVTNVRVNASVNQSDGESHNDETEYNVTQLGDETGNNKTENNDVNQLGELYHIEQENDSFRQLDN